MFGVNATSAEELPISRNEEDERSPQSLSDGDLIAAIDDLVRRTAGALPGSPEDDLLDSPRFLALNVEASLRGLPTFDEAMMLPGDYLGAALDFALELDRRRWLSTTEAGLQVPLVCGWRAISGPTTNQRAELVVPARRVIVGARWAGNGADGPAVVVRRGLERLLRFVDELEEVGRGDTVAALGLSRTEIEAAIAHLDGGAS